jgi:alkanesulfonate monooxygenase SsuD/methylene tetrahydromethanopterin reductase-like flavin-dependent oxidoreductase (luciferase family)
MGPAAEFIAQGIIGTPEAAKDAMRDYASAGMDELMMLPTIRGGDQLDRLADLIG